MENGNGVLRAVAGKQGFARFVKRQRVRLRAKRVAGILPGADGFGDFVRARVNDAQGVVARVRDHQPASVRRKRQRAGVPAGEDFGDRISKLGFQVEIDDGNGAFTGNASGSPPEPACRVRPGRCCCSRRAAGRPNC